MMPSRILEFVATLVGSAAPPGLMSALTGRSDRAFDMLASHLGRVAFFGRRSRVAASGISVAVLIDGLLHQLAVEYFTYSTEAAASQPHCA
jgi:hypothetical protein